MKFSICALVTCAFVSASALIYAANKDSAQFSVSINIKETCNIAAAYIADLDFGSINRASQSLNKNNHLAVTCSQGTPYRIALQSQREMVNAAADHAKIPYTLYQDASRTTLWGTDSQNAYSGTGTGSTQKVPVWGQVEQADTNVPAGQYSDKVTAVITY
ncbi:spore coat U domain-containing protein [Acinetobacter sp.]|uniref:Csu type fimbrial protein n=1 Tax=Acinetobacter sp. TaxID=472 RepID=UPI0035B117C4